MTPFCNLFMERLSYLRLSIVRSSAAKCTKMPVGLRTFKMIFLVFFGCCVMSLT